MTVDPSLDLFNVLNASTVLNVVQTYGSSLGRPLEILQGRIVRFSLQVKF